MFLESLSVELIQDLAILLDSGRALELETGKSLAMLNNKRGQVSTYVGVSRSFSIVKGSSISLQFLTLS